MKYAIFIKIGGEIIAAEDADYGDYKGFLRCPICKEPVFLRKAHFRNDLEIPSSFVHHKAVPEVSACELRVGSYTTQDIQSISGVARNQRLAKLTISMWKYLKHNLAIHLAVWSKYASDAKKIKLLKDVVDYGMQVLESNVNFITDDTLMRVETMFINKDPRIAIIPKMQPFFDAFLKENKSNWQLHCKIAKEALELFLSAPSMKEIRYRLLCCLCHPKTLEAMPELLDLDTETEAWKQKFTAYLTLQITFVFLTVNWVEIFDS